MLERQIRVKTRTSKFATFALSLTFAFGALGFTHGTVHAQTAANHANPYPTGTSAYWAGQNRPDLPANLGEAKYWAKHAASQGWPVDQHPRIGDIAVFQP